MQIMLWLLALMVMFSLPASAGNLFRAAELSDAELAELRGRYVMPGGIIHFGVTMSSVWEKNTGQNLGVEVGFYMNNKAQPSLYITDLSSEQGTGNDVVSTPPAGQVLGGAGLMDVQGISQSIRSAGDFNEGLNSLEVVVSRGGENATQPSGATPWKGPGSFIGAGGQVLVDSQEGGLKIHVDAGRQGFALQQIGNGNVVQQTNFTGDMNSVQNLATLSVALRDLPMAQDFANCTLEQLRALRPIGF